MNNRQSSTEHQRDDAGEFGRWISVLNRAAGMYLSERLVEFDLSPAHPQYLLSIRADESVSQDEIARRLHVDKANVTRAVSLLEKRGYLTRSVNRHDARSRWISLTEQGVGVAERLEAMLATWEARLRSNISADAWRTLLQTMKHVAHSALDAIDHR